MTAQERIVEIARGELGYLEKKSNDQLDHKTANSGHNNWTKYARDLDVSGCYNGKKNGYPWCDIFIDWCFRLAFGEHTAHEMLCQPHGGYGASCTSSAGYYKAKNRFFANGPQVGDQIFFSKDGGESCYHTGLVVKVDKQRVYTIEGNTSSAPGVVENGGAVAEKSYLLTYNKIAGYGRPDWSKAPRIWRTDTEEVNTLDNTPASWAKKAVDWAVANKIIEGDEKGNLALHSPLTVERFLVMLYRSIGVKK